MLVAFKIVVLLVGSFWQREKKRPETEVEMKYYHYYFAFEQEIFRGFDRFKTCGFDDIKMVVRL